MSVGKQIHQYSWVKLLISTKQSKNCRILENLHKQRMHPTNITTVVRRVYRGLFSKIRLATRLQCWWEAATHAGWLLLAPTGRCRPWWTMVSTGQCHMSHKRRNKVLTCREVSKEFKGRRLIGLPHLAKCCSCDLFLHVHSYKLNSSAELKNEIRPVVIQINPKIHEEINVNRAILAGVVNWPTTFKNIEISVFFPN